MSAAAPHTTVRSVCSDTLPERGVRTKSGIMLGLGERREEILQTMDDLIDAGCSVMTVGQYLQPTKNHYRVREYVHPDTFAEYARIGREKDSGI